MRVLVCGGRHFGYIPEYPVDDRVDRWREQVQRGQRQRDQLARRLDRLVQVHGPENLVIIHGGADGADRLAGQWAHISGIRVEAYPIRDEDWARWGKAAGPKRNVRMLIDSKPDLVIAFEGGRGTQHMTRIARADSVPVEIVEADQCAVLT